MKQREELEMWRSMYLQLFHGVERAIDTLVAAERACEEIYVTAGAGRNGARSPAGLPRRKPRGDEPPKE